VGDVDRVGHDGPDKGALSGFSLAEDNYLAMTHA
jgi:hypothetical protein